MAEPVLSVVDLGEPEVPILLRTRDLVSGYGRQEILHGVDVDVPAGRITTIIGPNGSGKSTFLKTVAGPVGPEEQGSKYFDFRVSRYPTGGYVEAHEHEVAEQVYYFLEGAGTAECGDETRTVGPGDVMFVPAGVRHSLVSTGECDLVFIVVTSPPGIPK